MATSSATTSSASTAVAPFPKNAPLSSKMFRGGDKAHPVQVFRAPPRAAGEYSGDWFLRHPGQKPELVLTRYPDSCNIEVIAETIFKQGTRNPVHSDLVVYMIAGAFQSIQATNVSDWDSFGTRIAPAGKKITPLDLFDLKYVDPAGDVPIPAVVTTRTVTPLALLYLVFAPLRLDANYADYKDALVARMLSTMGAMKLPPNLTPAAFATGYSNLKNNTAYLKLTAALDMFLNRFPSNEHANLRVGTIVSRFRDCSSLKTLVYFTSIMGVGDEDILGWIWDKDVARDIERVMDDRSAVDDEFGYGPYFNFMKFGSKSATSMTMNPYLHVYVHTIGIVMGQARSINAIMPSEIPYHHVMRTALAIGYAMTGPVERMIDIQNCQNQVNGIRLVDGGDINVDNLEAEKPPKGSDYKEWLHYYGRHINRGLLERHTFEAARTIHRRQQVYRDRTIGMALATFAATIVEH